MRSGYTAPLRLMLLPVLAVAVSCAPAGTLVSPSSDVERSYELCAVETASTGSVMIEAGRVFTVPTYSLTTRFDPPTVTAGIGRSTTFDTVSVDSYWEARRDVDGGYFLVAPSSYIGTNPLLHISDNGKIQDGWVEKTAPNDRRMTRHGLPDRRSSELSRFRRKGRLSSRSCMPAVRTRPFGSRIGNISMDCNALTTLSVSPTTSLSRTRSRSARSRWKCVRPPIARSASGCLRTAGCRGCRIGRAFGAFWLHRSGPVLCSCAKLLPLPHRR